MKKSKGTVGIETIGGRLRIRLPRDLFGGKQKYISLGLSDKPEHYAIAERKAKAIQSDIDLERFDISLEKYKQKKSENKKIEYKPITLIDLWDRYLIYLKPIRKQSTIRYLQTLTPLIKRASIDNPCDSLGIREWLINHTSEGYTKRVLVNLSAAYNWGIKNNLLVSPNPYLGLAQEFKQPYEKENTTSKPVSLSKKEIEYLRLQILANPYHCEKIYIFDFWINTGCRPSSALAVKRRDVSLEERKIIFRGSFQNGEFSEGSKNNKIYSIPISDFLLQSLGEYFEKNRFRPDDFIFPFSQELNSYRKFFEFISKIVGRNFTAYNCRDTFVTSQILANIPIAIIAKWIDSSVGEIEKKYFDNQSSFVPI